jgi:hypothetical protein
MIIGGRSLATCCIYGGAPYETQERAMKTGVSFIIIIIIIKNSRFRALSFSHPFIFFSLPDRYPCGNSRKNQGSY